MHVVKPQTPLMYTLSVRIMVILLQSSFEIHSHVTLNAGKAF